MGGLGSRSRRRGQRRRRWWSAGARASTDGRRTRSPRWRGRSRNDGSSPSANRGGGRDGERLTSSRVARSTADTTCCGSPRSGRRRGGAAARGRDGEAGRARCRRDRHARRDPRRAGVVVGHHHVAGGGFGRPARVDAVEYDGYPDAEPLLSLEEETWRQVIVFNYFRKAERLAPAFHHLAGARVLRT